MRRTRRPLIAVLAVAVVAALGIGGTVAWLTAESDEVVNTFTVGDVDIDLTETWNADGPDSDTDNDHWEVRMVPGTTHAKDPLVTVKADSEDCWVFLEVTESASLADYVAYAVDQNNWTLLKESTDGNTENKTSVYYCYSRDVTADRAIKVLAAGSHTFKNGTDADEGDDIEFAWEPNQVLVKPEVTKEMMEALNVSGAVQPTLTFKAYAVQMAKSNTEDFTPEEAWEIAKQ